jgi:hypothetical protein
MYFSYLYELVTIPGRYARAYQILDWIVHARQSTSFLLLIGFYLVWPILYPQKKTAASVRWRRFSAWIPVMEGIYTYRPQKRRWLTDKHQPVLLFFISISGIENDPSFDHQ